MNGRMRWRQRNGALLLMMVFLAATFAAPVLQAEPEVKAVKTSARWSSFLKGLAGFVGGGVLAAALGAGGVVTLVAAVGGAIVAPHLFKKVRELTRQVFGNDHQVELCIEPNTQDEKAALYIQMAKERARLHENAERLPPEPAKMVSTLPSLVIPNEPPEVIMEKFEDSYKAYIRAAEQGNVEEAKKYFPAYKAYQTAKQAIAGKK